MVILAVLMILIFSGSLAFMIMSVILSKTNIKEEEKDPVHFLLGNINYVANDEMGSDYRTAVPSFMTRYGYDYQAFPDEESAD
ncbi:MAG: hypothetical protein ILA15_09935 [Clostridiales bacterium]|jgi:hypothetical protein|nr:hypothetical protein [Clostridiales bacterium]